MSHDQAVWPDCLSGTHVNGSAGGGAPPCRGQLHWAVSLRVAARQGQGSSTCCRHVLRWLCAKLRQPALPCALPQGAVVPGPKRVGV